MEHILGDLEQFSNILAELSGQAREDSEVYRCPKCRDTGYIIRNERAYPCDCHNAQAQLRRSRRAGLTPRLMKMTFDSFDLSFYPETRRMDKGVSYRACAEKALRAARFFVYRCQNGQPTNGLLLAGEVGSGKTHLAAAVGGELSRAGIDVLFLVVPEFLDQLRGSYRRENEGLDETQLIRQAYDAPVLILDDLGAHNFTDWVRNKLFTIINHRYNHNLPCVITTNLTLNELDDNIGSRATSRIFEACDQYTLYTDRDLRLKKRLI